MTLFHRRGQASSKPKDVNAVTWEEPFNPARILIRVLCLAAVLAVACFLWPGGTPAINSSGKLAQPDHNADYKGGVMDGMRSGVFMGEDAILANLDHYEAMRRTDPQQFRMLVSVIRKSATVPRAPE